MSIEILVVDDKRDFASAVALVVGELPEVNVRISAGVDEALARAKECAPHIVISDVSMPRRDGFDLLREFGATYPKAKVILITGFATIDAAVLAIKSGAFDYVTKPISDDDLLATVARAIEDIGSERELDNLARDEAPVASSQDIAVVRSSYPGESFHGIWYWDPKMGYVVDAVRRVAPSMATVLVYGESGTGKERFARALHEASGRKGPFVAFSAAAVPETLAESELFGSKKGAFTGAERDRRGLFLEANGGTLFIDEVSSMPMSIQGKLLRALQEREVMPVGASAPVRVDVRIVVATNVEPQKLLGGVLRKDLYYRLSVVRLALPALRDRPHDVPGLARHFVADFAQQRGEPLSLTKGAEQALLAYGWPGNVRELHNVIERAAVMTLGNEIGVNDLVFEDEPGVSISPESAEELHYEGARQLALERFQRRYFDRLIEECNGNLSETARRAKMTRAALHRILKRIGRPGADLEG